MFRNLALTAIAALVIMEVTPVLAAQAEKILEATPIQQVTTGHDGYGGNAGAVITEVAPPDAPDERCIVAVGKWRSSSVSVSCFHR